jgi:ABC-type lipoprotein export system ATPase subunit
MIRLVDIHKSYDPQVSGTVLDGLNLDIESGQFVSLLGRSGSGKTTLLNIIGGLDRDFRGQALVDGHDLKKMKDGELSEFRNRTIAFVFQAFNLLPHLSCKENVAFPAYFGTRVSRQDIDRKAHEAMERVGIAHKANSYPGKMSGGEKQRIAIARAIFQQSKVLLADEPTGNLDSKSSQHIMELFMQLIKEDGLTCVMVTHDEQLALTTDRVVRIVDGVIVGEDGA